VLAGEVRPKEATVRAPHHRQPCPVKKLLAVAVVAVAGQGQRHLGHKHLPRPTRERRYELGDMVCRCARKDSENVPF